MSSPSRLLFLVAVGLIAFHGAAVASSSIGLYTDESGSTCSFTGNASGLVTAYLVIRPDEQGITGVRFAAPVPDCFGAVFINDTALPGTFVIGDTQTGISVAIAGCVNTPQAALAINYFRNGSTSACCPFPIVADPSVGTLEAITCSSTDGTLIATTSHLNADESCPCEDHVAPLPPFDPLPADHQGGVAVWPTLTWHANDWNNDIVEYDVYLGPSTPPARVATVTIPSFEPLSPLDPLTNYYWRVVARDSGGRESQGPLWALTTRTNSMPLVEVTTPEDNATDIPIFGTTLNWFASDADLDGISFDVYFGTNEPPPLVASTAASMYSPGRLEYDTVYYWRVLARDGPHSETSTPVVRFATRDTPPQGPSDPYPVNLQVDVPTQVELHWTALDPEGEPTTNKMYFGTDPYDPPLVASNIVPDVNHVGHYSPPTLNSATRYYWTVAVRDVGGIEVKGPIWSFVTVGNHPPAVPSNPTPPNGATILALSQEFAFTAPDPDPGQTVNYYVYVGTTNLGLAAIFYEHRGGTGSVELGPFTPSTQYRWKVVADDRLLGVTYGPEWTFTTPPFQPAPPAKASNPIPADASVIASSQPNLAWTAIDPQSYALTHKVYFGTSSSPPQVGTTTSPSFPVGPLAQNKKYYWKVRTSNGVYTVTSPTWSFTVQESAVPVLFSRFEANAKNGAAQIRWQLESDEAMESYTIYRREKGSAHPVVITTADVSGIRGSFLDGSVSGGTSYQYEMVVRTAGGDEFRSQPATVNMPVLEVSLGQNHPNPFNPQTTIPYVVPANHTPSRVRLLIYDASGRMVRTLFDGPQAGGAHEAVWTGVDDAGTAVSSGVYLCVLEVGKERRTQKLVLLK